MVIKMAMSLDGFLSLLCHLSTHAQQHTCTTTHMHHHTTPLLIRLAQFESGAMLLYLAETLGGADSPAERAELAKWILFANSTMVCMFCV